MTRPVPFPHRGPPGKTALRRRQRNRARKRRKEAEMAKLTQEAHFRQDCEEVEVNAQGLGPGVLILFEKGRVTISMAGWEGSAPTLFEALLDAWRARSAELERAR